ncbi:MAG: hypothetical protein ACR2OU_00135 [Thermomicrobiales bacterium]
MENENVIFAYTLAEAIDDGVLVGLGWAQDTPLIGTAAIVQDVSAQEREGLFRDVLRWQRETEPGLAERDRMVVATASTGQTVWVIDDGVAMTLLYPSDY